METLVQYKRDLQILHSHSFKHVKNLTKYFDFLSLIGSGHYGAVFRVTVRLDQPHFFSSAVHPGKVYALKITRAKNTREAVINAVIATSAVPKINIARTYMWWRIMTTNLDDQLPRVLDFNTSGQRTFYLTLMEMYDTNATKVAKAIIAAEPDYDFLLFRKASAAQLAAGLHCIRSVIPDFFHLDLDGENILANRQDIALVYLLPDDVALVVPTFLTNFYVFVIADMGLAVGSYLVGTERVPIGEYTPNTVPDLIEIFPELNRVLTIGNEWDCYLRALSTEEYFAPFRCAATDVEAKIHELAVLFGDELHNPVPRTIRLPTSIETRTQRIDNKISFFYSSGSIDHCTLSVVQHSGIKIRNTRGNTKFNSASCSVGTCVSTPPKL